MIQRRFGRRRDEINDYWNGGAREEQDAIWPYWVISVALVAVVVIVIWIAD